MPARDERAGWGVPVYVASLLLLFGGERVVPTDEEGLIARATADVAGETSPVA